MELNIPINNNQAPSEFDYSALKGVLTGAPNTDNGRINAGYDPASRLQQMYTDNVEGFKGYSGGEAMPYIMGSAAAYETRAQNQSGSRLFGNSLAQFFLGEFMGGTVSGVGILARPDKWAERVFNTKDAFETGVLEELGNWVQEKTKEKFPIYQTQEAQKGVAWTDASWYATMVPSIASALSIMIPARAAAILPGKFVKILGETNALSKAAKLTEEARAAGTAITGMSKFGKAEHISNVVFSAIAGRMIDSSRESLGKYNEYYQDNMAKGMNDTEARTKAADAAARGFRLSHANIVFDLIEWSTMLKMGNYLEKGYVEKIGRLLSKDARYAAMTGTSATASRFTGLGLDLLKTSLAEGTDEMTMDIFQNEGKYQSDVADGTKPKTQLADRLSKHLDERKSWDSFVGGAAGGIFMLPFGQIQERLMNKDGLARMKDQANTIVLELESNKKLIESISAALEEGDANKAQMIKDSMLLDAASKAYANGSLKYIQEMFDNISKTSPEELVKQGMNVDTGKFIEDMKDNLKMTSDIYEKEMDNVRLLNEDGSPDSANFSINLQVARLKSEIAVLDKRIAEDTSLDGYDMLNQDIEHLESKYGKIGIEYLKTLNNNQKLLHQIKAETQSKKDSIKELERNIEYNNKLLTSDASGIIKLVAKNQIQAHTATIENLKIAITKDAEIASEIAKQNDLKLKAFEGIDSAGNRLVKEESISEMNDYFNKSVEALKDASSPLNRVSKFKARKIVASNLLEHYLTPEGQQQIKTAIEEVKVNTTASIKEDIEAELEGKTSAEIEAIAKKYRNAKEALDPKVWKPLVDKALKETKARESVAATNAAREKANATQSTSAEGLPLVPGTTARTITPSVEDSALEQVDMDSINDSIPNPSKGFNSIVASITEFFNKQTEEYPDLADMNADLLRQHLHGIKLLDLALTKELRATIGITESIEDIYFNNISNGDFEALKDKQPGLYAVVFDSLRIAQVISESYSFEVNKSRSGFDLVGSKQTEDIQVDLFTDTLEEVSPVGAALYAENIAPYIELVNKQFSEVLWDLTPRPDEDINDQVNEQQFNTFSNSLDEHTSNLNSWLSYTSMLIKQLVRTQNNSTGSVVHKITFNNVLSYLRDTDQIYDRYHEVFFGLKTYKNYVGSRINHLNSKLKKLNPMKASDLDLIKAYRSELQSLEIMDSLLDIGKVNELTLNDNIITEFIKRYPKQPIEVSSKSGIKAILNTFDSEGNPVDLDTFDVNTLPEDSKNIYNELSEVKPGAEVLFNVDHTIRYEGSPEEYSWFDQPIGVSLKANTNEEQADKGNILFISSLTYVRAGIQYGREVNGDYNFHGISEILTPADYEAFESEFELVKKFYFNYRQALSSNKNDKTIETSKKIANETFSLLRKSKLNDVLLRIINQNLPESKMVDKVNYKAMASVLDAMFYKVRLEYIDSYYPSKFTLNQKVVDRDNAYLTDFNLTKSLRRDIAEGILTSSKIGHVSTPPILNLNDSFDKDGKLKPRYTMDVTVKPLILNTKGNTSNTPRIVIVTEKDGKFYDLSSGEIIEDSRFDVNKELYNIGTNPDTRHNLKVLLEAPNGKLIPYNATANTIGASYTTDAHRAKAVTTVVNGLVDALIADTEDKSTAPLLALRHITIYDQHAKPNSTSSKPFNYLESYFGSNMSRVTFTTKTKTKYSEDLMFHNMVLRDNKVSIYSSTTRRDIIETDKHPAARNAEDEKRGMYDINISTEVGKAHLKSLLEGLVPDMLRQAHIDGANNKFTYDKDYKGEPIVDSITGETYDSPQDLYIRTGAIYTRANAIYGTKGTIVSNFDVKGRFPMVVTIENTARPDQDFSVKSVNELVGKNSLIDPNDPYLDIIRTLEQAVAPNVSGIFVTRSTGSKAIADTTRSSRKRGKTTRLINKFDITIRNNFFVEKGLNNPFMPASMNIAHEFIHTLMNKKYMSKAGETQAEIDVRHANILYHNKAMSEYIAELNDAWNAIKNKELHIAEAMGIDIKAAERYVANFNTFLERANKEAIEQNANVERILASGGILQHKNSIQEVITYAYSNPFVAIVLNSIEGSKNGETFKAGQKNTFWNKLINKFFSILNRLFNVEFNDASQMAKLNSLVNDIFNARYRSAKIQAAQEARIDINSGTSSKSKSETKKNLTDIRTEDTPLFEDTAEFVNGEFITEFDPEIEGITRQVITVYEDGRPTKTENYNGDDLINTEFDSQDSLSFDNSFDSALIADSAIIRSNINPFENNLDGLGLPIC